MIFLSEHYLAIKYLHILTAVFSVAGFCLRFLQLMHKPAGPRGRWIRVLPHINDTLLLTFAILLCFATQQAPLVTPWLSEKVLAVILYILAGMFALKWEKGRAGQIIWFIISLTLFAYAANIAISKAPLIF
ncbi:MAG: SirB2 family protein [Xanthomonadales bacterium]|nr:SirB2 family protein [Xanthomonadales bacterium]